MQAALEEEQSLGSGAVGRGGDARRVGMGMTRTAGREAMGRRRDTACSHRRQEGYGYREWFSGG